MLDNLSFSMQSKTKVISDIKSLAKICENLTAQNQKIVMTNGCFDIIHPGHVYLLAESKKLGDVLIVAVNSDASVRRLKGDNRPINNQDDRLYVLSGLQSVDYVILFDEETPEKLICSILPDILVKGSDYRNKEIAGRNCMEENEKRIILVDILPGKSTTNVIDKASKS